MTGPRSRRLYSRRVLLQTGALGLVGAAGCTGGLGDEVVEDGGSRPTTTRTTRAAKDSTTEETTEGAVETTTTTTEPLLALEDLQIQSSFFYRSFPDAAAVAARERTQFAFAELRLVGSTANLPSPDDIALTADDQRFEGTVAPGSSDGAWELYEREQAYASQPARSGWVAFEVPDPLDADRIALVYEADGRTFSLPLDSETVETLARPPAEFEVVAFDFPESVGQRESFEISVAVENASEIDGVFRAVLNQSHPSYTYRVVELNVPANGRREWSRRSDWNVHDAEEGRFTLLTPVGDYDATVEVVAETTTA